MISIISYRTSDNEIASVGDTIMEDTRGALGDDVGVAMGMPSATWA